MKEKREKMDSSLENLQLDETNIHVNEAAFRRESSGKKKRKFVLIREKLLKAIVGTSLVSALVACGMSAIPQAEQPETEVTDTNQDGEPVVAGDTEGEEQEDVLPADLLQGRLNSLSWQNRMKTRAEMEAELNAGNDSYQGPTYTPEKGGDTWVSEEDYQAAVDVGLEDAPAGTTVTTVESGYLAPDGTVWESEAEYQKYIQGQNEVGTTEVESGYVAPDGTIWTSEAEYQKYVQSNNGTTVLPGSGEVVEQGEGYHAPDGTYWTSEAEYQEFINSSSYTEGYTDNGETLGGSQEQTHTLDEYGGYYEDGYYWVGGDVYASKQDYLDIINMDNANYGTYDNNDENYQDQQVDNGNYYTAPDGTIWESEEDYLSSLGGSSYEETYDDTTYTSTTTDDSYYTAPDGTIWENESDYIASLQNSTPEAQTVSAEETSASTTEETTTEDDYYIAPDGTVWVSEEDYLAAQPATTNIGIEEASYQGDAVIPGDEAILPVEPVVTVPMDTGTGEETTSTTEETPEAEATSDDFFVAPDGTVWVSEEEYNLYISSLQAEAPEAGMEEGKTL